MALPIKWIVDTDALNGRTGPSTKAPIKLDAKGRKIILHRGDKVWARREVTGDGRTWLVTRFGTHYAKQFCRKPSDKPKTYRVVSPVPNHGVTTPWGKKPNNRTYWQARGHHTGADFAAVTGATVIAITDGTVHRYRDNVLGNVALLYARDNRGRKVTYWYCHLSALTKTGKVKSGEQIGRVGMTGTGAAMGPHLHFEIRDDWSAYWGGRDYNPIGTWA